MRIHTHVAAFCILTLCIFSVYILNNMNAKQLATGTVTKVPKYESFILRFKVSKEAKPGLQFYPNIRFVLDDGTWIDGHLGCFPSGAPAGSEAGGDLSMWDSVAMPKGRTLEHVAVLAVVGDPRGSSFGFKQGESIPTLDDHVLKKFKKVGGFVLRFPVK